MINTTRRLQNRILSVVLLCLFSSLSVALYAAAPQDLSAKLQSDGLLITLAGIFLGGMLVSLTPCVYPMIPITLSIIGARSAESKPLVGFARSLIFVLGIATIYTVLGLVVALSGGTVGFLLQNKSFLLGISVFFIIMGLGMLGLFNLQLPPSIAAKVQGTGSRGGYLGAFLLGITTGVVASPCGSPVLFSVITLAGASGKATLGAVMLFTYALGIGMLFLVLGTFPAFLSKMPKSGVWMEDIKKFLGIVLIIAAFYYLKLALPEMLVWGMLIATALIFAIIIAVKAKDREVYPRVLWAWRLAGLSLVGVAVYASLVAVPALLEREAVAKRKAIAKTPTTASSSTPATSATLASGAIGTSETIALATPPAEWLSSEPEAIALATKNKWPVIVDLGAEWCAACKELEHKTFPDPAVEKAMAGFVKVRIDCTEETPENAALQKKYNSMSLPTVAFIDAQGNQLPDLTLYEFEKPQDFIKRIEKVPAK